MLKWLLRRLGGPVWRIALEARIEALEDRAADLADRFQRFQNRQNMRKAREAADTDSTLLDEAQSILEAGKASSGPVTDKLDLWAKRRH